MKRSSVGAIILTAAAAGALLFSCLPAANSQIRANPSFLPIGSY